MFCDHIQLFLWASWLPVFWTLHLLGWLSLHHLVLILELWSVLSFGPYFFCLEACYGIRGRALGIHQGGATHITALWCCMWGRGLRGNNAACSVLGQLSVTSPATHKQIGPFWRSFPGGWACVHSRTLWVSPKNSPVRLGVFPTAITPTGFYSQRFWGFISHAGALGFPVCLAPQLFLLVYLHSSMGPPSLPAIAFQESCPP